MALVVNTRVMHILQALIPSSNLHDNPFFFSPFHFESYYYQNYVVLVLSKTKHKKPYTTLSHSAALLIPHPLSPSSLISTLTF